MNCLNNIIGVKSKCNNVISTSGMFIEDIGITPTECDFYINSDYKNGTDFILDKINFATQIIKSTITNHFDGSINTRSLIDAQAIGLYQDSNQIALGGVNTLGGISITLNNSNSYYNLFVNELSVMVDYTGTINIFIYDLGSNTLLDTISVVTVANKVTSIYINKTYSSNKRKLDLLFAYDTEGINSINTPIYSGCGNCVGYKYSNYYITSSGVMMNKNDSKLRSSLVNSNHTFGISLNYSIQCSIDNWVCEIANMLAMPILYKTGELIMDYALLVSKRQTSNTNVDYERNQERRASYAAEYNNSLQTTVGKIRLPKGDPCFTCNERLMSKIILP